MQKTTFFQLIMIDTHLTSRIFLTLTLSLISTLSYGQKIFSVKTDNRVEALSIFFTLATADTLNTKPTPSTYYRDVKAYFERYKDHTSLNWYRKLDSWDGPDLASIGLFLSSAYPFKLQINPDVNYIRSAPIDSFLFHFNAFYKDCQVSKFIANNQKKYQHINKEAESYIEKSKIINDVATFYKSTQEGRFIIFTDILCNHGSNAITSTDKRFAGSIMSKAGYIEDKSQKMTDDSPVNFKPAINVVAHECSHIYLKGFLEQYHNRLIKIKDKFLTTSTGKIMPEEVWENEIDELLVRACVAKILAKKFGTNNGQTEIDNQAKHFKWARELYVFLDKYTQNRDQYSRIEDFYPEIIVFLETL